MIGQKGNKMSTLETAAPKRVRDSDAIWSELKKQFEAGRNIRLNLTLQENGSGLVAFFKGVRCFLPKAELPADILPAAAVGLQWVRIYSLNRETQQVLVTLRLQLSNEEIRREEEQRLEQANARRRERLIEQADFDSLEEGQWVDGTVQYQLTFDRQGKVAEIPYDRYVHREVYDPDHHTIVFVRIGEVLLGGLSQRDLSFAPLRESSPRLVEDYFHERMTVHVRVVKKSTRTDKKGRKKLQVKLSMLPEKSRVSRMTSADPSSGRTALGDALTTAITKQRR